jgi:hypothetical protein
VFPYMYPYFPLRTSGPGVTYRSERGLVLFGSRKKRVVFSGATCFKAKHCRSPHTGKQNLYAVLTCVVCCVSLGVYKVSSKLLFSLLFYCAFNTDVVTGTVPAFAGD